ncbi:MAG: choice-of-anchor D domain-containing protein [Candidatus Kapabacteria bacterium]|nr:choice-of-anchor D domain-containing protein [Candidatus Kapabacteria bacterium]
MYRLIYILLISTILQDCFSQSISIFNIDTSSFPIMKAKYIAFDNSGVKQKPNIADLNLIENNISRVILNSNCSNTTTLKPISLTLSIDLSGSMEHTDFIGTPFEFAKLTSVALCNEIELSQSDFALQTSDEKSTLLQDFTNDKSKITNLIPSIKIGYSNDFNEHLLNKFSGLLNVAKKGKNRKIAVLFTDAWWKPMEANEIKSCIDTCNKYNIELYVIVYSRKEAEPFGIKSSLKTITNNSNGYLFDDVISLEDAKVVAFKLKEMIQGSACEIKWQSGIVCKPIKTNIELEWNSKKAFESFDPPFNSIAKISSNPSFISFGKKIPIMAYDTTFKLTSENTDLTVTNIKLLSGSNNFSIINTTFPFVLPKNSSKDITIRFTATDSNLVYANFEVQSDLCPIPISCYAGFADKKIKIPTLKLTNFNGGETYVVGSDTLITWKGVSPKDTVELDYSIDNGNSWTMITNQASGMYYNWKNIPRPISNQCKLWVRQNSSKFINKDTIITLKGHTGIIYGVAFSPDGSKVATGSYDSTAKIWDPISGLLINTFKGHNDYIYDLAFSKDGSKLITGSFDHTAKIWDVKTGTTLKTLIGHKNNIYGVAYSPDGIKVATASSDSTIKIWDALSGSLLRTLSGHNDCVNDVSFSSDGTKLVSSSLDKTAKVWDVNNGSNIYTFTAHKGFVLSAVFSSDGKYVVSGSYDKTAMMWDAKNGTIKLILNGHSDRIDAVAFSPDDSKIITGSLDQTAIIWDVFTGAKIKTLYGHNGFIYSVAFSPDGSQVITGSWDQTAKIWNVGNQLIQEDISDNFFSIALPLAKSQDVDFKKCLVGSSKDTLVVDFIQNAGKYPLRIDSIFFTGVDANAFIQTSGFPKFYIDTTKSKTVELSFKPTKVGIHNAKVNIISQTDTLVQNIKGEGIAPDMSFLNDFIDFGQIKLEEVKDTLNFDILKNIGTTPINITNIYQEGPNKIDYSILTGIKAFILNVGETLKLDVRFKPSILGRTNGKIIIEYDGVGSPKTIQLFGQGIYKDTTKITLGTYSFTAKPNDTISVPILLVSQQFLNKSKITSFEVDLTFNSTILLPLNYFADSLNKFTYKITFKNLSLNKTLGDTLALIKFVVALGNTDNFYLTFENPKAIGDDAVFSLLNGHFILTGICNDGGERLLNGTTQSSLLSIYPNPVSNEIELKYSNVDNGFAEFKMTNLIGEVVLSTQLEKIQNGKLKLEIKNLPTGQYIGSFITESIFQNYIIKVIR